MRSRNLVFLLEFAPRDSAIVVERCLGNRLAPEGNRDGLFVASSLTASSIPRSDKRTPPMRLTSQHNATKSPSLGSVPWITWILPWIPAASQSWGFPSQSEATRSQAHVVLRPQFIRNPAHDMTYNMLATIPIGRIYNAVGIVQPACLA